MKSFKLKLSNTKFIVFADSLPKAKDALKKMVIDNLESLIEVE